MFPALSWTFALHSKVRLASDIVYILDRPSIYLVADYETIGARYGRLFLWTTVTFYMPFLAFFSRLVRAYLERVAGSFDAISTAPVKIKTY